MAINKVSDYSQINTEAMVFVDKWLPLETIKGKYGFKLANNPTNDSLEEILDKIYQKIETYHIKSIAIPLFQYDKECYEKMNEILSKWNIEVFLMVPNGYQHYQEKIFNSLDDYIKDRQISLSMPLFGYQRSSSLSQKIKNSFFKEKDYLQAAEDSVKNDLLNESIFDDVRNHLLNDEDNFQERLFSLIDERGLTDVEVYKKAGLDRKLFSKIRSNKNYIPKKVTILSLAIALRLDIVETKDLLSRAGYALSPSNKFDMIIEFCLNNDIYDFYEINYLLDHFHQSLLI